MTDTTPMTSHRPYLLRALYEWLADNGHLEEDESELLRTFTAFAGTAGSHPGMSDATECQLRRHFVTALITFGITKLEEG